MSNFTTEIVKSLYLDEKKFNSLMREELESAVNELLKTEITAFLGYEKYSSSGWNTGNSRNGSYTRTVHTQFGDINATIPRDRAGEFQQQTVPAYAQHTESLEQLVIHLYSHGVTTSEIADIIEKMYGHYYSKSTISAITMSVEEQVTAFHSRKVESKYAVIYCDATYLHLRRDTVSSEALHIILGVTPNGHKEVLDYAIYPTESAGNYREMMEGLKSKGLEQVLLFVSDGLTGIKNALQEVFPRARYQSCWVHLSRNVFRTVRVNDRTDILEALKSIYTQKEKDDAKEMMSAFLDTFSYRYPKLLTLLEDKDNLFTFYDFPKCIQRSIYSTNLIENCNKQLKHQTKKKEQFPNEGSLERFVCSIYSRYNSNAARKAHIGFSEAEPELLEMFETSN